jgi:hypothetical protein
LLSGITGARGMTRGMTRTSPPLDQFLTRRSGEPLGTKQTMTPSVADAGPAGGVARVAREAVDVSSATSSRAQGWARDGGPPVMQGWAATHASAPPQAPRANLRACLSRLRPCTPTRLDRHGTK